MALYTLSLGLELTSLLRLRWTEPHLARPYRVPLGRNTLVVAYLPCLGLCATMVLVSLRTWQMCAAWVGILGVGWALYTHGPTVFRPNGADDTKRSDGHAGGNGFNGSSNGVGNANANGSGLNRAGERGGGSDDD